jgi:iron complex outermembrane receptor protein
MKKMTIGTKQTGGGVRRRMTCRSLIVSQALCLSATYAHAQSTPASASVMPTGDAAAVTSAPPTRDKKEADTASVKSSAPPEPTTLNTVVVTAMRRREPAREVPMQLNTISADKLQQSGASKLSDYITSEPGITMQDTGGLGAGTLAIRGITTGANTGPTVGAYIDDVPFGSSTAYAGASSLALDMGLLDLDHIEILRGPQGTLYGAGAMGGVLKYVTREPDTYEFGGLAGVGGSYTSHGGFNNTVNAMLNVPLKKDVAAVRFSFFNNHDAGYVDEVGVDPHKGVEKGDETGARASLLLTPSRDLTLRFTATTQNINRDGNDFVDYGMNGQPLYGDLTRSLSAAESFHQNIQVYSAGLEYDLHWARFNSITAYQQITSNTLSDDSSIYVPIFAAQGLQLNTVGVPFDLTTKKFTQEFRLTSEGNHRLEWLGGLFFTHESSMNNSGIVGTSSTGAVIPLEEFGIPSSYKEYAAYGDATFHVTSRLDLTAGMRIAHNNQTYEQTLSGAIVGAPTASYNTSADTSKTYMFTASYKLTPNSNVYARVASGYRPGGPNDIAVDPTTGARLNGLATFQPDSLWSYELGYKADLFDKRLSLALAAYQIDWHSIQQVTANNGVSAIANAGDAKVRGLELSSTWRPTQHFNFGFSAAYTDAFITQGNAGAGSSAGDRLPYSASFSAALSASYLFTIGNHHANVSAAEQYIGRRHSAFSSSTTTPDFIMPAYATTNLQAGIDMDKYTLSFFVRNVFNRRGITSASTAYVPLGGSVLATVIQPRTIGLQLNAPF